MGGRKARSVVAAWLLLLTAPLTAPLAAHEGPPFPILMDQPTASYLVSVWADPDIGEARFFVALESRSGVPFGDRPPEVTLWVEPVSGRLARVTYPTRQQTLRNRLQFAAEPYFDQRDEWRVGVQITEPGREPREFVAQVESTPPGLGPWDLAVYLFPFLLFGGLWVVAFWRRRTHERI